MHVITQVFELWAMVAIEHGLFQEAAAIMQDRKKVSFQGLAALALCALVIVRRPDNIFLCDCLYTIAVYTGRQQGELGIAEA